MRDLRISRFLSAKFGTASEWRRGCSSFPINSDIRFGEIEHGPGLTRLIDGTTSAVTPPAEQDIAPAWFAAHSHPVNRKLRVMMSFDPATVMQSRRESRQERDLKQWLRTLSDEHRFEFVSRCLDFRGYRYESRALNLATSCINSRAHALAILRRGLVCADASSIKFWLRFAVAKLGGRRVLKEVARLIASDPDAVNKALYWLPWYLPKSQRKVEVLFGELREMAKERGIAKGPITTRSADGKLLFSSIYPRSAS